MKCKELAEEYGLTAMRIGKIRRKKSTWLKARGDLTPEQVAFVRDYLDRQKRTDKPVEPHKPKEVLVIITNYGHLSRYMECMEQGRSGRFFLLMPYGVRKENFSLGQKIKAIRVKHEGKEIYIHPTLSRQQWEYCE